MAIGIKIAKASWEAGYQAGYERKPAICSRELDGYSFYAAYIEGKAKREADDRFKG